MRLIGHYLDRDIIFDLIKEDAGTWIFQTRIPAISSGYIVLELYAIDDAGNIGTAKESIVLIDFLNLTVEVLWSDLSVDKYDSGIHAKGFDNGAIAKAKDSNYTTVHFATDYGVVVLNDI
jgi:hypothetical protein